MTMLNLIIIVIILYGLFRLRKIITLSEEEYALYFSKRWGKSIIGNSYEKTLKRHKRTQKVAFWTLLAILVIGILFSIITI